MPGLHRPSQRFTLHRHPWFWPAVAFLSLVLLVGLSLAVRPHVGTPAEQEMPAIPGPTAAYLMSFDACQTKAGDCSDPANHRIYLAESANGEQWQLVEDWRPVEGAASDIIRRGNMIYVYWPDRLIKWDLSNDTRTIHNVEIIDENNHRVHGFTDPTVTIDEQGRMVLFFLTTDPTPPVWALPEERADCIISGHNCTDKLSKRPVNGPAIMSAVEAPDSGGIKFRLQAGKRTATQRDRSQYLANPDIFHDGRRYVLYVSQNGELKAYTSAELHDTYKPAGVVAQVGEIASGHFDPASQRLWTFIQRGRPGRIARAIHDNFKQQLIADHFGDVLSGRMFDALGPNYTVEQPGFAPNR